MFLASVSDSLDLDLAAAAAAAAVPNDVGWVCDILLIRTRLDRGVFASLASLTAPLRGFALWVETRLGERDNGRVCIVFPKIP